MVLINLFLAFLRIGLFAIGGAYSFLPLIQREVVDKYHWLTEAEFFDVLGITQIFPGAISIKYATYTGYKIAGVTGAVVANLGNIFAPALIIILTSFFYSKYKDSSYLKGAFGAVRLVVFAMIIAVAFRVININSVMNIRSILIIILSFTIFIYTKVHPAIVIILAAIVGLIWR